MNGTVWTYTGAAELPNGKYAGGFQILVPNADGHGNDFRRIIGIDAEFDTREEALEAAEKERQRYLAIAEFIGLVEPDSTTEFGSINPN